jgi:hypothetical protein
VYERRDVLETFVWPPDCAPVVPPRQYGSRIRRLVDEVRLSIDRSRTTDALTSAVPRCKIHRFAPHGKCLPGLPSVFGPEDAVAPHPGTNLREPIVRRANRCIDVGGASCKYK